MFTVPAKFGRLAKKGQEGKPAYEIFFHPDFRTNLGIPENGDRPIIFLIAGRRYLSMFSHREKVTEKIYAPRKLTPLDPGEPPTKYRGGHSVGTILTIPLVAELLRLEPELGTRGPAFGLVSLGNCLPLVSLLPGSVQLREDLKTVATAPGVRWLDFSARRDGASVTQVDPLKVSGISRPAGIPVRPQQFPVRIVKMFAPADYAVIRKDIFRIHFQYIMAGDLLTDYDFFAITAGPLSLAERFPESH